MNASARTGSQLRDRPISGPDRRAGKDSPDTNRLSTDGPHANGFYAKGLYAEDPWVRAADLPRINQSQSNSRGLPRRYVRPDLQPLKSGKWFDLTRFAQKLHHRVVHLSEFRGKKVLVVTWASW